MGVIITNLPPPPRVYNLTGSSTVSDIWYKWFEQVYQQVGGGSGTVLSFNGRTGDVVLGSGDIYTALGYVPYNGTLNPLEFTTLADVAAAGFIQNINLVGPVSGSNVGSLILTTIAPTGVVPGTYTAADITVEADGRVTSAVSNVFHQGYGWDGIGGSDTFFLNGQFVSQSYTIPSSYNASSVGPVTILPGVTVTISPGSYWVIEGN